MAGGCLDGHGPSGPADVNEDQTIPEVPTGRSRRTSPNAGPARLVFPHEDLRSARRRRRIFSAAARAHRPEQYMTPTNRLDLPAASSCQRKRRPQRAHSLMPGISPRPKQVGHGSLLMAVLLITEDIG